MNSRRQAYSKVGPERGQMMLEYSVMFTVIVAVIIAAATMFIKPAVNKFWNTTNKIIDRATETVENNF